MKISWLCALSGLLFVAGICRADAIDPPIPFEFEPLPIGTTLPMVVDPPNSGPDVIIEVTETDSTTGVTDSVYEEFPVTPGLLYTVTATDTFTDTGSFSGAGYFLSPTFIPLDDLNPPLGPYTPLPGLDGSLSTIPAPADSFTVPTPLPHASWGIVVCLGGLALLRMKRQTA